MSNILSFLKVAFLNDSSKLETLLCQPILSLKIQLQFQGSPISVNLHQKLRTSINMHCNDIAIDLLNYFAVNIKQWICFKEEKILLKGKSTSSAPLSTFWCFQKRLKGPFFELLNFLTTLCSFSSSIPLNFSFLALSPIPKAPSSIT